MAIEREVMLLGIYKTFEELEDNLTIEELNEMWRAMQDTENRRNRFSASLQGIDLDSHEEAPSFEQVKRRAEARMAGKDEETIEFEAFGISITKE